jgi:hypothetical protein
MRSLLNDNGRFHPILLPDNTANGQAEAQELLTTIAAN